MMQNKPKENEIEVYAFGIGVFRLPGEISNKAFEEQGVVINFIVSQPGFIGFHLVEDRGTLCIFQTEPQARETRLSLLAAGCPCGDNVSRVFVRKADVEERLRRFK